MHLVKKSNVGYFCFCAGLALVELRLGSADSSSCESAPFLNSLTDSPTERKSPGRRFAPKNSSITSANRIISGVLRFWMKAMLSRLWNVCDIVIVEAMERLES